MGEGVEGVGEGVEVVGIWVVGGVGVGGGEGEVGGGREAKRQISFSIGMVR